MKIRTTRHLGAAIGIVIAALTAREASAAGTNDLGTSGQLIIGGNRLVTVLGYESSSQSENGTSNSSNQLAFGVSGSSGSLTAFTIPRFGLDYAFMDHWTLGGDVLLWTTLSRGTNTTAPNGVSMSGNSPKETLFGLAPRIGYVLPISDQLSFWPRAGFSFAETNIGGGDTTVSQWAIDLEPLLVFSPAQHFGLTVGPVVDIPLTGSFTETTQNGMSQSVTNANFYVGLTAGMIGYF